MTNGNRHSRLISAIVAGLAGLLLSSCLVGLLIRLLAPGRPPEVNNWVTFAVAVSAILSITFICAREAWRRGLVPDPTRCEKCGYLLRGLSQSTCPQCGTPFDSKKVKQ